MAIPKINILCSICNETFYRQRSVVQKVLRNSGEWTCQICLLKNRNIKTKKKLIFCSCCKREFLRVPSAIRTKNYCSRKCKGIVHGMSMRQENHHGWKGGLLRLACNSCGDEFTSTRVASKSKAKYCSYKCMGHGKEKIGSLKIKNGYILQYLGHGNYKGVHRIIAEKVLGRPLKTKEIVHHINKDRADNRHSNLLVCSLSYHAWLHRKMERIQRNGV